VGEGSSPLQTSHVTVEVVLVARDGTRIGVLQEGVVTPSIGQRADAASIAGDPQWAVRGERTAVAGARLPPIGGGVDHRVATSTGIVGVGETADPADHRSSAQTIASGARRVVCPTNSVQLVNLRGGRNATRTFDVEGTWEGDASSSHRWRQKLCSRSARGPVWNYKVIGTSNETSISGINVLRAEVSTRSCVLESNVGVPHDELTIALTGFFGRLDVSEGNTLGPDGFPVDIGRVGRDVDALRLNPLPEVFGSGAEDGGGEEERKCESLEIKQHHC
jgi:hypothetical protein